MIKTLLTSAGLAAVAGAALLAVSAAPASAFTLTSPSLAAPVASAEIEHVWYDRWHRWHGPRHCYRGRYGRLHCGW